MSFSSILTKEQLYVSEEVSALPDNIFIEPLDRFVGGRKGTYRWKLYTPFHTPFNATGCVGFLSLTTYSQRFKKEPILRKNVDFLTGEEGILNVVSVTFESSDTENMDGEYVYQLIIKDIDENVEIPIQGSFFISKNINT